MVTLNLTEEQVLSLIEQLSSEEQDKIFQALLKKQEEQWHTLADNGQKQIRNLAEERNKNWDKMTEEEREDFINDLVHEDRKCL